MDEKLLKKLKKAAATLLMSNDARLNAPEAWQSLVVLLPETSKAFHHFLEQNDWLENKDEEYIQSLMERQSNHWRLLFSTNFSEEYVKSAVKIGLDHVKFNTSPSNYIFGYAFALSVLMRQIDVLCSNNPSQALELTQAINSLMLIDMSLVLSIYNKEYVLPN